MSQDLPKFAQRSKEWVERYIGSVLSHSEQTSLVRVEAFDDGHFRAFFNPRYFILPEDKTVVSKSQWSTLKKRMKRINKQVFVFKEHGETADGLYYVDFGFFAD